LWIYSYLPVSPVAGVWADRYNRIKLIVIADGMIALSTLILAIVFMMGYEEIWLLFLMAGIRALGHRNRVAHVCPLVLLRDKQNPLETGKPVVQEQTK